MIELRWLERIICSRTEDSNLPQQHYGWCCDERAGPVEIILRLITETNWWLEMFRSDRQQAEDLSHTNVCMLNDDPELDP